MAGPPAAARLLIAMLPHNTALEAAWRSAEPILNESRTAINIEHSVHPRIIRVGQLDAELLDKELASLIQEPLNKALSLINTTFRARFEPELSFFIQLTLYKLSVWNNGATYGAKLQDLRYFAPPSSSCLLTPSGLPRNKLLIHGTLTLILPYLHNRIRTHALSHAWPDAPTSDYRRKIWEILGTLESVHACLGLASFIAFLWNGKYRTLVDRLLRMSLIPSRRLVKRDVSYEFMNRQMVWHAFTEFLLFLLPLISARTIRRKVYRLNAQLTSASFYPLLPFRKLLGLEAHTKKGFGPPHKRGKFWTLPKDQCAICAENALFNLNVSEPDNIFTSLTKDSPSGQSSETEPPPHPIYNPYQTSCGHIYCYHCIAERVMRTADEGDDDSGWECLRCAEEVKEAHRYTVGVVENEPSESDYEFSSDIDMGTDLSGSLGSYSESGFSE